MRSSALLLALAFAGCVSSDALEPDGSLLGGGGNGGSFIDDSTSSSGLGGYGLGGYGANGSGGYGATPDTGGGIPTTGGFGGTGPGSGGFGGSDPCGDGTCSASEDCDSCEADCGPCPVCGDDVCEPDELCELCPEDCGACPCVADAFEPNNNSPNATDVSLNVDYCDLSICTSDVDWFEFTVTGSLTAEITFSQLQGDLDLEIFSGITNQYIDGSYSGDSDESVSLAGLPAGKYWARAYGKSGAKNFSYCFRVEP